MSDRTNTSDRNVQASPDSTPTDLNSTPPVVYEKTTPEDETKPQVPVATPQKETITTPEVETTRVSYETAETSQVQETPQKQEPAVEAEKVAEEPVRVTLAPEPTTPPTVATEEEIPVNANPTPQVESSIIPQTAASQVSQESVPEAKEATSKPESLQLHEEEETPSSSAQNLGETSHAPTTSEPAVAIPASETISVEVPVAQQTPTPPPAPVASKEAPADSVSVKPEPTSQAPEAPLAPQPEVSSAPVAPVAPPAPPPPSAPSTPVGQSEKPSDISEVHLKKTPPPSPKPLDQQSELMAAIRQGTNLDPVQDRKDAEKPKNEESAGDDFRGKLNNVLNMRRGAVADDTDDDGDDNDDWLNDGKPSSPQTTSNPATPADTSLEPIVDRSNSVPLPSSPSPAIPRSNSAPVAEEAPVVGSKKPAPDFGNLMRNVREFDKGNLKSARDRVLADKAPTPKEQGQDVVDILSKRIPVTQEETQEDSEEWND